MLQHLALLEVGLLAHCKSSSEGLVFALLQLYSLQGVFLDLLLDLLFRELVGSMDALHVLQSLFALNQVHFLLQFVVVLALVVNFFEMLLLGRSFLLQVMHFLCLELLLLIEHTLKIGFFLLVLLLLALNASLFLIGQNGLSLFGFTHLIQDLLLALFLLGFGFLEGPLLQLHLLHGNLVSLMLFGLASLLKLLAFHFGLVFLKF